MSAALVAAVLEEWRRAERIADGLPAGSPERRSLEAVVEELRILYAEVTDASTVDSAGLVVRAQATVEEASSVLNAVSARLANGAISG